MKTRILHTRIWEDNYFSKLSVLEKLTFIYLLTNDKVSLTGIYEMPDKYLCFNLDASEEDIKKIKEKFQRDNKFIFKNGWIKIVNHDKYNSYTHGKSGIARDKELSSIPEDLKLNNTSMDTSIDSTSIPTINHKSKTINQNIRVVKGKYSSINSLKEEDFVEIASSYKVSVGFVKMKFEALKNYCESKGRRYKNYKSTLRNFVLGDIQKAIVDRQQRKGGFVSAKDN